ncbi:MAG: ABC transporter permease [Bacteroidota bacterium]
MQDVQQKAAASALPSTNGHASAAGKQIVRVEPPSGWQFVNWREVLAYRDLLWTQVHRGVTVAYKQTVMGFGWAIFGPVFSMVVFTVIFGNLAKVPSDGVPYALFSYTALLPWQYFAGALGGTTSSLVGNRGIFTKVYFPRLILPLVPLGTGLVGFGISFGVLICLMIWYAVVPTLWVLFLPVLIAILMLTALGVGLWLSSLALQYRDVGRIVGYAKQLLMYAAPVVWPVSLLAEKFPENVELIRILYGLYPMAGVIEGFRAAILGTVPMPWDLIGMGTITAVVLTVTGAFYFRRTEHLFADVA